MGYVGKLVLVSVLLLAESVLRSTAGENQEATDGNEENGVKDLSIQMEVTDKLYSDKFRFIANVLDPVTQTHKCTGVLIKPDTVLAPASCLEAIDGELPSVRIGSYDINGESGQFRGELRKAHQKIYHEGFIGGSGEAQGNDIALLVLETSSSVDPVPGLMAVEKCDSDVLTGLGWFKVSKSSGHAQKLSMAERLYILDEADCEFDDLPKGVICARTNAAPLMLWDHGSPLLCNNEKLVGMAIHTTFEQNKQRAYLYTSVGKYLEWIVQMGKGKGVETGDQKQCNKEMAEEGHEERMKESTHKGHRNWYTIATEFLEGFVQTVKGKGAMNVDDEEL